MFDLLSEAVKLLKINSVTLTGTVEIAEYLYDLLKRVDLPAEIQKAKHKGVDQYNLICRIEGKTKEEVIFNTHLDTVPPGDPKKWDKTKGDPFNPTIMDGRIYGLGSADTKLDYLAKLKALLKYKNEKFVNPLTFIGTYGEEMGLYGCEYFLKSKMVQPKWAFVGEPTGLNLVYAHKGMINLRIELPIDLSDLSNPVQETEFLGESAHGSTPHLGRNAISMAIKELKSLPDGFELVRIDGGTAFNMVPEWSRLSTANNTTTQNRKGIVHLFDALDDIVNHFNEDQDTLYDPPISVLNIGKIETDTDKITITLSFRMLPKRDFQVVQRKLETVTSELKGKLTVERMINPMHTDPGHPIIQKSLSLCKEVGISAEIETKPVLTEASLYEERGAHCVVFGPGIAKGNIHKPNEWNDMDQLEKAVRFYEKVIETFCLEEIVQE